jgi:transcriptional regulator with PAS, ATPase and Fis domain
VRALQNNAQGALGELIGESPAMAAVKRLVRMVAASPASTVLLCGETGTGKDMVAHVLHASSVRAKSPFLNITCSALPSTLMESELFGHERGAFTDAKTRKLGLLEHADGGTIFLDEIAELVPATQGKLLRFLEEKTFRRVGGTVDIRSDVRIIAATNADLREAMGCGEFREDLYYRLSVVPITLPPLREREDDLELLASVFIDRFNLEFKKRVRGIGRSACRALRSYSWPGNVRELRNIIERAMLLASGPVLEEADLRLSRRSPQSGPQATFHLPLDGLDLRSVEQSFVQQALARCGGNQTQAGKLLGLTRDQIRYRLAKYDEAGPGESGSSPRQVGICLNRNGVDH